MFYGLVFDLLDITIMRPCSFMFLGPWLLFCPIPTVSIWFQILQNTPSRLDCFIILLVVLSVSDPSCQGNLFEISVLPCTQLIHPYLKSYRSSLLITQWGPISTIWPRLYCLLLQLPLHQLCPLTGVCCVLSIKTLFLLILNPMHPYTTAAAPPLVPTDPWLWDITHVKHVSVL